MTTETKSSNPKEAIGSKKLPTGLVPDGASAEETLAFLEGALKYGRYNWRIDGVRASTYNDAMERHRKKWWNGQNRDPVTRVHHLASLIASAKIILDAELCALLEDDRPPAAPVDKSIDDAVETIVHLKELFKGHNPKQYSIKDSKVEPPAPADQWEPGYITAKLVPPIPPPYTPNLTPQSADYDVKFAERLQFLNDNGADE